MKQEPERNKRLYQDNLSRFNIPAIDSNGEIIEGLVSLGFGLFVRVSNTPLVNYIAIDSDTFEMQVVTMFRIHLNPNIFEQVGTEQNIKQKSVDT